MSYSVDFGEQGVYLRRIGNRFGLQMCQNTQKTLTSILKAVYHMIGTADYISLTTCRTFRANSGELINGQEQVEYIRNCGKLTFPSAIGKLFYEKKS